MAKITARQLYDFLRQQRTTFYTSAPDSDDDLDAVGIDDEVDMIEIARRINEFMEDTHV